MAKVKSLAQLEGLKNRLGGDLLSKEGSKVVLLKQQADPETSTPPTEEPPKEDPVEATRVQLANLHQEYAKAAASAHSEHMADLRQAIMRLEAVIVEAFAKMAEAPAAPPATSRVKNLKVVITSRDQNRDVKTFNIAASEV